MPLTWAGRAGGGKSCAGGGIVVPGRPLGPGGELREGAMGEADRGHAASYNYSRFDDYVAAGGDLADEAAFRASPRAGQRAEDFTLPRLGDQARVRLSELWRSTPLVMEFGSFT